MEGGALLVARIRSIHPGLFTDESFVSLPAELRVFLLILGTQTDYADRFRWADVHADGCLINAPAALEQLEAAGMVRRDGDMGEVLFAYGFSRRRVSMWEKIRSRIFERDQWACTYCGEIASDLHCDLIVPVSRGGTNDEANLTTACKRCNLSKGAKSVEAWGR